MSCFRNKMCETQKLRATEPSSAEPSRVGAPMVPSQSRSSLVSSTLSPWPTRYRHQRFPSSIQELISIISRVGDIPVFCFHSRPTPAGTSFSRIRLPIGNPRTPLFVRTRQACGSRSVSWKTMSPASLGNLPSNLPVSHMG